MASDTTEQDKIIAEAKKRDEAAKKESEQAEFEAKVTAARRVFAPGEVGPGGTAATRLAQPGEVTDAAGNPDPYGAYVNRGTSLEPEIVPVATPTVDVPVTKTVEVPDAGKGMPTGTRVPLNADGSPVTAAEAGQKDAK